MYYLIIDIFSDTSYLVTYSELGSASVAGTPPISPGGSVLHIDADGLIIPAPEFRAFRTVPLPEIVSVNTSPVGAVPAGVVPANTIATADVIPGNGTIPVNSDQANATIEPLLPNTPQEVERLVAGLPEEGKWYTVVQGRCPGVYPNMCAYYL